MLTQRGRSADLGAADCAHTGTVRPLAAVNGEAAPGGAHRTGGGQLHCERGIFGQRGFRVGRELLQVLPGIKAPPRGVRLVSFLGPFPAAQCRTALPAAGLGQACPGIQIDTHRARPAGALTGRLPPWGPCRTYTAIVTNTMLVSNKASLRPCPNQRRAPCGCALLPPFPLRAIPFLRLNMVACPCHTRLLSCLDAVQERAAVRCGAAVRNRLMRCWTQLLRVTARAGPGPWARWLERDGSSAPRRCWRT